MKSLLFVSICLIVVCCSCAPSITRGFQKSKTQTVSKEEISSLIHSDGKLLKYNMIIDFMKKHFSGMLLIKQIDKHSVRTLFSTHFGLSLFDLEIRRDTLIVHHCIEPLQRKSLLSLLQKDLNILFGLNLLSTNEVTVYIPTSSDNEILYRLNDSKIFYRKDLVSDHLKQIKAGKGFGKTIFRLIPDTLTAKEKIQINHPRLRLSIQLETL